MSDRSPMPAPVKKASPPRPPAPPSLVARYAGRQSAEVITTPDEAQAAADNARAGTIVIVPGSVDTLRGVAWQKLEADGLIARK